METVFEAIEKERKMIKSSETHINSGSTDDKSPSISYTQRQKERQENIRLQKLESIKQVFLKYAKFYDDNYPESNRGLEWSNNKMNVKYDIEDTRNIEEILDDYGKDRLVDLYYILKYSKKEYNENGARNMKDHYSCLSLEALIRERVPVIKEHEASIEEWRKILLKIQHTLSNKEFELLKSKLKKDLENAVEKLYICELCGLRCKKRSGLASHMKYKHQTEQETE